MSSNSAGELPLCNISNKQCNAWAENGIACAPAIAVPAGGRKASWLVQNLKSPADEAGLFDHDTRGQYQNL
jgi:hypothetical protein